MAEILLLLDLADDLKLTENIRKFINKVLSALMLLSTHPNYIVFL